MFATDFRIQDYLVPEGMENSAYYWQVPVIAVIAVLTYFLVKHLRSETRSEKPPPGLARWKWENTTFLCLFAVLTVVALPARISGYPLGAFQLAAALLGLWLLLDLAAAFARERLAVRLIAISAYVVIALHLLDALDTAVSLLYGLRLQIGSLDVSAYGILTGAVVLVFMLWFAQMASRMVSKRISSITSLSPSIKVLIGKAVTIILIATAILVSVDSMGLDLTVLSVLGGGLGVGLGFGLQKVVSNFVSGLILLTDRSIKPGDVIEIDETYGWINTLSARYVSVITRDGTEHLIPNEDLITQKVINWSFTNNLVRLRIPVGVAYDCDIHLARKLILDASNTPERVLRQPAPICHLLGFGDSSVDFELRVWINDPSNGIANVKSAILLKTWDLFKEHDIEIPFPQRDLHLKPPAAIDVTLKRDRPAKV